MRVRAASAVLLFAVIAGIQPLTASGQDSYEMREMMRDRGCYLCHSVEPRAPRAEASPPYGPAWREIARKYKGREGAEDLLIRIVLQGTDPAASGGHWKGKAAGGAMAPNAVEISEADARKLVRWILSLGK